MNIMVLGAGRGQVGLYKAARELGHKSIAVSIRGNYPGFEFADYVEYENVLNKEGVLELAKKHSTDAIVTACVDITVPTIGYVCDNLGLKGLSYNAAVDCTNKLLMKKRFQKNNVRAARYIEYRNVDDIKIICNELRFPLISKPVDLAGSKGIRVIKEKDMIKEAVLHTMSETKEDYCIIEEYLDGYEISASGFIYNGDILFLFPMGDVRYGKDGEVPIGHYIPFEEERIAEDFMIQMTRGAHALNLDNCAINADLMIVDGQIYILEMTGRLGANCIPELTSIYMGTDINKLIIEAALGNDEFVKSRAKKKFPKTAGYAKMLFSEKKGRISSIILGEHDMGNADIDFFIKPGDEVRKFSTTNDCIGQVVAFGDTVEEAKYCADKAISKIAIDVE